MKEWLEGELKKVESTYLRKNEAHGFKNQMKKEEKRAESIIA